MEKRMPDPSQIQGTNTRTLHSRCDTQGGQKSPASPSPAEELAAGTGCATRAEKRVKGRAHSLI